MFTKTLKAGLWIGTPLVLALAAAVSAQPGRDDDGAVLRLPGEEPKPRTNLPSAPGQPASAPVPGAAGGNTADVILANLTVDPRYAMNRDIQPTPEAGPWMICVHSYITKEAPEWARQMAGELRSNSSYRLPAYVFTYGLEERRKEYERVKDLIEKQRKALKAKDLEIIYGRSGEATVSNDLPLAYAMRLLKVQHMPVQCAVLVGGYASEDAAHRALLQIKKLPQPDPNKVKLDVKFYGADANPLDQKNLKIKRDSGAAEYVNPFHKAFVCRNPAIKQDHVADGAWDAKELETFRRLNHDEPYSLLKCKKPITLAIKQFQTFTTIQARDSAPGILEKIGFNTRGGSDGVDQAAHDAHNLAELLRTHKQLQVEAYVLHSKYSSVVTVGGFDSVTDPNLIAMQNALPARLTAFENALREQDRTRQFKTMMFFPRPTPMKVPR